jgi:hypothetical protein
VIWAGIVILLIIGIVLLLVPGLFSHLGRY